MRSTRRRHILETAAIGFFPSFGGLNKFAAAQSADKVYNPKDYVRRVNAQWTLEYEAAVAAAKEREKRGEFASLSPPGQLVPFGDWDYYYTLGARARWAPNQGQPFKAIDVPQGFVTDLASIPQEAWSLGLRPEGRYAYAALIHDYLYWTQDPSRSREEADKIFLFAMEDWKVPIAEREAFYRVLRLAGGSAWNKNADLKREGERRILKIFPSDLSLSWAEWKKKPGVFAD